LLFDDWRGADVTGRRVEGDEVDDADGDLSRDVGGEGASDGHLDGVGDLDVTTARDGEGVRL
jgi:hypothetical protein